MTWVLRVIVAAASIVTGALHYDIWANHGYKSAPVKEIFIAQAIAAIVAGLLVLAPIRLAAIPAIVVSAASLVAFALSRTSSGVPTLHGKFTETGLAPKGAEVLGLKETPVVLVAEVVVVAIGLLVVALGRARGRRTGSTAS